MNLRRKTATLSLVLTVAACSSEPRNRDVANQEATATHVAPTPILSSETKADETAVTSNAAHSTPAPVAAAPAGHSATPVAVVAAEAKPGASALAGSHAVVNLDGEKALRWLKNGNIRFRKGHRRADGLSAEDRKRLIGAEYPHSIILSCSDSRVAPEHIFDQRLGEITVVRSAGQGLDFATIASVEEAIERTHSRLVVVMGHESCPVVKAALENPVDKNSGSPYMNQLVGNVRNRIIASFKEKSSEGYILEADANAAGAATELMNRSEIIKKQVKAGQLSVVSGVYHLESGEVVFTNANVAPRAL